MALLQNATCQSAKSDSHRGAGTPRRQDDSSVSGDYFQNEKCNDLHITCWDLQIKATGLLLSMIRVAIWCLSVGEASYMISHVVKTVNVFFFQQ